MMCLPKRRSVPSSMDAISLQQLTMDKLKIDSKET